MSNCQFCGKTNPIPKGNKRRKFCSKKCSKLQYKEEGRYYAYVKKNPNWGEKGPKDKERKAKNKLEWEKWSAIWLTRKQVAEKLNITTSGLHNRMVKAEERGVIVQRMMLPDGNTSKELLHPETIELLRGDTAVKAKPEGYITLKEVVDLLGIKLVSFHTSRDRQTKLSIADLLPPDLIFQENHGNRVYKNLYLRSKVEAFHQERQDRRLAREEAWRLNRVEKARQKALVASQRAERIAGLLTSKQASKLLGFKAVGTLIKHMRADELSYAHREDIVYYWCPQEVSRYLDVLMKRKEDAAIARKVAYRRLFPRRLDDYTSPVAYEKKLMKKLIKQLNNSSLSSRRKKAANVNIKYVRDAKTSGSPAQLHCKSCKAEKPYYDFYYELLAKRGRTLRCKACQKKQNLAYRAARGEEYDIAYKEKRQKNFRQKFRNLIATAIKRDIARNSKVYPILTAGEVWEALESSCGYNVDQFLKHLESQFDSIMTWGNHGRGKDSYHWQVDHIIPRSALKYTSLSDPLFKDCWVLTNLRPLDEVENISRGNKAYDSNYNIRAADTT